MKKRTLLFAGVVLFIAGMVGLYQLWVGEQNAIAKDDTRTLFAMVGEDTPPSCSWKVESPERVMPEDKTQAIIVKTSNTAEKACETFLTIQAPGFDVRPSKDEKKINLPEKGKGSVSWVLSPNKSGSFDVTVSDILNTKIYGITVTNTFGLTTFQAKIASVFGTLFGPMLTLPWWWDRVLRKKTKIENNSAAV